MSGLPCVSIHLSMFCTLHRSHMWYCKVIKYWFIFKSCFFFWKNHRPEQIGLTRVFPHGSHNLTELSESMWIKCLCHGHNIKQPLLKSNIGGSSYELKTNPNWRQNGCYWLPSSIGGIIMSHLCSFYLLDACQSWSIT